MFWMFWSYNLSLKGFKVSRSIGSMILWIQNKVLKLNPVIWLVLNHQSTGKNWNIWNFDFLVIGRVWLGFVQKSAFVHCCCQCLIAIVNNVEFWGFFCFLDFMWKIDLRQFRISKDAISMGSQITFQIVKIDFT